MAITQAVCNSFKTELLGAIHDLDTDVFFIALYTSAATLGASTTAYTASGESSGTNYTAGGIALTGGTISLDGSTAIVDFNDATFNNVSITARGALIYNSSKANRAVAVLDFGADNTVSDGDFNIIFPAAAASTAVIRIT